MGKNNQPKKTKQNEASSDAWLLPYADMLTLLLALFIVLFAMSKLDAKKYEQLSQIFRSEFSANHLVIDELGGEGGGPEVGQQSVENEEKSTTKKKTKNNDDELYVVSQELKDIQQNIEFYIAEKDLTSTLGTQLTDEGLLITILTDISFDSGSAYVNQEGREIAKEIAEFLYTDPPHEIVISGHADDRPMYNDEFKSNWELSVIRAVNFMLVLLENEQLSPEKFSAKGYGEYQPIAPNTNSENRAKNRRVEVLIQPNIQVVE